MMKENKITAPIAENPVLALFLGACPAMAATRDVHAALGMGAAVLAVMLLSSLILSLIKKLLPDSARIPACVLVTAGVTAAVQLLMRAYLPEIYQLLGAYLAIIAVNLLVFCVGERSGGRGVGAAMLDGLLTGLGFAAVLFIMAAVREIFGAGSFAGLTVPFFETYNIPILRQASGGFAVFAIMLAVINGLDGRARGSVGGFTADAAGLTAGGCRKEGE